MCGISLMNRGARITSLAALFSTTIVTAAQAQDSLPLTILGRIVLGSTGEQVAIDTPQAVTVIEQKDLDREAATTVGELLDDVPGVQNVGVGNVAGQSFNIRGIGEGLSGDESRIIITVDGATKYYEQYRMGSVFTDPELFKRVEILRGPASSTLYGSGALGGVVAFETKDASDFLQNGESSVVRLKGGYQSNGNEVLESVIYATEMGKDSEGLFALNYRKSDEYVDGDGTAIEGSAFDSQSVLAKLKTGVGDDETADLTFSLAYWQSFLDDTSYDTIDEGNFGTIDRDTRDITLSARYEDEDGGIAGGSLDATLSYALSDVRQEDASSFGFLVPGVPVACGAGSLFSNNQSLLVCDSEYSYSTTSLDIKNTNDFNTTQWTNYLTTGVKVAYQDRVADADGNALDFHPEGQSFQVGVLAELEAMHINGLSIIPGVRFDYQKLTPGAGVKDGVDVEHFEVSPKVAAHKQINDSFAMFGSLVRTNRLPTIDEVFSSDEADVGFGGPTFESIISPDLRSEVANTVELGFSSSAENFFMDRDVAQVKVTGFYSKIQDLIELGSGAPRDNEYTNAGSATIYGIEVEGALEADQFFARAAYSRVRGEDDAGDVLDSVPADTLALTVGGRNVDQTMAYGLRNTLVSEITNGDGTFDAYKVHDLFLDWTPDRGPFEGTTISTSVSNIFDAVYQNSLSGGSNGQGRSINLNITRSF